jgi:hypothetical protein
MLLAHIALLTRKSERMLAVEKAPLCTNWRGEVARLLLTARMTVATRRAKGPNGFSEAADGVK